MIIIIPKVAAVTRRRNLNHRHCERSEAIQNRELAPQIRTVA
ncbi:hypothetical protein [Bradyrhizobium daqingense]